MIYDVEFFYEGRWHFHNQETSLGRAENWAAWLRRLGCEVRIVEREH